MTHVHLDERRNVQMDVGPQVNRGMFWLASCCYSHPAGRRRKGEGLRAQAMLPSPRGSQTDHSPHPLHWRCACALSIWFAQSCHWR